MNTILTTPLLLLGAYLLGSIPFGVLIGKLHGVDVTAAGSTNIGATNVARLVGRPWGILVFLLDMVKGFLPALLAGMVFRELQVAGELSPVAAMLSWLAVGLGAVLGHNYSIMLRFRGGRGISTTLGVCLGVAPHLAVPALAACAVWAVVVAGSRYVSLGSVAACAVFPVLIGGWSAYRGRRWLAEDWPLVAFALLVAVLGIYRHRQNLRRLLSGTESKMGARAGPGDMGGQGSAED